MATYLFTWAQWPWTYLHESIAEVKENGYCRERWSCGVTKKIRTGDRAFLIKLGQEPYGIVASGWVTSEFYEDKHWDEDKAAKGKTSLYVDIDWDTLLDPDVEIFPGSTLETGIYAKMHWKPQASGITIPDEVADQLERDWAKFLNRSVVIRGVLIPEEVDQTETFAEGTTHQITVNVYERNPEARTICINHYGPTCSVCGFSFEEVYGQIGEGFIHVHHLKPLAQIRKGYRLKPIEDLRPVCPNCHAMLHHKRPAYSIKELKSIMKP